jgi:hypothetical protein
MSTDTYYEHNSGMNLAVTVTAPTPTPGMSDDSGPTDHMDTSSDGDLESSPRVRLIS